MDIRRKVLIIICVLRASMVLSSCDKGGNHTESELGGSNMSDVDKVVMNEENKLVEPKDLYLINKDITNENDWETSFTATPGNGENLNIAVKSYNKVNIICVIWVQGVREKRVEIKGNEGITFKFFVLSNANFRVKLTSADGQGLYSASVRARQFD